MTNGHIHKMCTSGESIEVALTRATSLLSVKIAPGLEPAGIVLEVEGKHVGSWRCYGVGVKIE